MNKSPVAQQAKTTNGLLPTQGLLQRQCACGRHTMGGGQCADCVKKNSPLQPKLTIGASNDPLEQEADRVAEQVLATPAHHAVSGAPPHIQRYAGQATGQTNTAPASVERVLARPGRPLDPALAQDMGQRFGHDFSQVRVYSDAAAEQSARDVNANAYTVGNNIVFGAGRFALGTHESRRLVAHELAHVVQQSGAQRLAHAAQQRGQSQLQRQAIPQELRNSVNVRLMKPDKLQARYDSIVQAMKQFAASTPDYRELEVEMQSITNELARREALKAGRTFGDTEVTKMKEYFVANATSAAPKSCIACMNDAMRILLGDSKQRVGSEVEKTMAKLQQSGHAGEARVIEFEDTKGRITYGTLYPDKLHESVWEAVKQLAGVDVGWSVFGMSVMDGNHSVTLTLDNNNPLRPTIYWSDQWSSKGGWKPYNRAELDAEVTRLIQGWWNKQPENRKFNTRLRLWRLNP